MSETPNGPVGVESSNFKHQAPFPLMPTDTLAAGEAVFFSAHQVRHWTCTKKPTTDWQTLLLFPVFKKLSMPCPVHDPVQTSWDVVRTNPGCGVSSRVTLPQARTSELPKRQAREVSSYRLTTDNSTVNTDTQDGWGFILRKGQWLLVRHLLRKCSPEPSENRSCP